MKDIKSEVYKLLKPLGLAISQTDQAIFHELPALTFTQTAGAVSADLGFNIGAQEAEITINFWAETSKENTKNFQRAEEILRRAGWHNTYTADIPNPADEIFHLSTRFFKKM